eukprot:4739748-Prorocentrum_lima.AAC.1
MSVPGVGVGVLPERTPNKPQEPLAEGKLGGHCGGGRGGAQCERSLGWRSKASWGPGGKAAWRKQWPRRS